MRFIESFIFLSVTLMTSAANSLEPSQVLLKNMSSGEVAPLYMILKKMSGLVQSSNRSRRDFESLQDYRNDLQNYESEIKSFTKTKYATSFKPDEVSLDWENSNLLLKTTFPSNVLRKRGKGQESNLLKMRLNVPPDKGRQMVAMNESLTTNCIISINKNGDIEFHEIKIYFFEEMIYEE